MTERVDGVDEVRSHADEAAALGDQPRLALERGAHLEARSAECSRQAAGRHILVDIAGLELHDVNLTFAADTIKVRLFQHRTLAQLWAEVVDKDASNYILRFHRRAVQA